MGWLPQLTVRSVLFFVAVAGTVILEAAFYIGGYVRPIVAGQLPLPPSVIPMVAVMVLGGDRVIGKARSRRSAVAFWLSLILVSVVTIVSVAEPHQLDTVAALALNGLNEELIYRLALPALLAFGLSKLRVPWSTARGAGYCLAGAWFLFLPGHVRQWTTLADLIPFVAFTILATLAIHRSGALLEVGLLHGLMNLINIGRINGEIDVAGSVLLAALIGLLLVAYMPTTPDRRVPEPDEILDLRVDRAAVRLAT